MLKKIVMIIIGVKAIHSNFPNGAAPRGKMRCRLQKTRVTKKDEYEYIWKKLCFCRGLFWEFLRPPSKKSGFFFERNGGDHRLASQQFD